MSDRTLRRLVERALQLRGTEELTGYCEALDVLLQLPTGRAFTVIGAIGNGSDVDDTITRIWKERER